MTTSPMPAPSRSATTTMLRVGSLSNSIGCTSKNRTPSRSGDFFVDQTVPTTLPKNISSGFRVPGSELQRSELSHNSERETRNSELDFSEHFRWLAQVACRGGDDRARVDVNLLALLDGATHVVFGDELNRFVPVCRCRLRAAA